MRVVRWLLCVVGALVVALSCRILGTIDRSRRLPLWLCHYFGKYFLPILKIQLKISSAEEIDWRRNYIVCSNHQGLLDIFALMGGIPLPLRFVSKPSYFKIPIIGWGMRGAGHIEVTRTDKEKDRLALDQIARVVRQGASVMIFPEGTRSRDGTIGPFKRGAFYVATQAQVPILPVTIRGSFERMKKGHLLPEPGIIEIFIHAPLSPVGESIESLQAKTREIISSKY